MCPRPDLTAGEAESSRSRFSHQGEKSKGRSEARDGGKSLVFAMPEAAETRLRRRHFRNETPAPFDTERSSNLPYERQFRSLNRLGEELMRKRKHATNHYLEYTKRRPKEQ